MAVIGANRNVSQPKWAQPWALYAGLFVLGACLIWTIALTFASSDLRSGFRTQMAQAEADHARQIVYAKRAGLRQSANAVAASIRPLLALKGQVPEITDRTLQSVVTGLLERREYSFVAITDADKNVLASSDLALIGKTLPDRSATEVVTVPIGFAPCLGWVALSTSQGA